MSSRALRKAQKLLEEQEALKKLEETNRREDGSGDEQVSAVPLAQRGTFALLENDEHEGNDSETNGEAEFDSEPVLESSKINPSKLEGSQQSKRKRKKKKKNIAVKEKSTASEEPSRNTDDIDEALRSLQLRENDGISQKKPDHAPEKIKESPEDAKARALYKLLSVNPQNLHVLNEVRRLFGRDAIDTMVRPAPRPRRRGHQQQPQQATPGFPALSLRRNIFIRGKEEWPRATTGGLGMETLPLKDVKIPGGPVWYRFVHSTAYQDIQRQYEICVASMDPTRLILLLQQNNYHIATLLQVSEIYKHEQKHTESGDLLERTLFTFGRAVHSNFAHNLSEGKARLDFNRPENREFYLSVWRYMQNLAMRGTWRTVYEWSKLLLSLDPDWDAYCMRLVMDQYALKAQQSQHFIELCEMTKPNESNRGNGEWASQIPWSLSLAYLQTSQSEKAYEVLTGAVQSQPWLCNRMFKELDLNPIPPALWSYHEPPTAKHALFMEMYCVRAKDLWNTPDAKDLLKAVALKAQPEDENVDAERVSLNADEARHIHLTQNDTFIRLLANLTADEVAFAEDLGPSPATDPFPPVNNIVTYDPRSGILNRGGATQSDPIHPTAEWDHMYVDVLQREIERIRAMAAEIGISDGQRDGEGIGNPDLHITEDEELDDEDFDVDDFDVDVDDFEDHDFDQDEDVYEE